MLVFEHAGLKHLTIYFIKFVKEGTTSECKSNVSGDEGEQDYINDYSMEIVSKFP